MRAVLQRVSSASVSVDGQVSGKIDLGILAFVGVEIDDTESDAKYVSEKIATARFFNDEQEKMNLSIQDVGGSVLVVSQFTLHGDCRRGRRPSFIQAARPETAIPLYEYVLRLLREQYGLYVACGVFGARMEINLCNDGPVTLLLDSRKTF